MNSTPGYSNSVNNLENVQIEVLFKKKMMLIERPKHYSDFVFIFALGIIILLASLASSLSPYTCLQFSSSRLLHSDIWKSPLVVTIKDISPYNSYVSADLQFVTFDYNSLIQKPIDIKASISFFSKNKIMTTIEKDIKYTLHFPNYQTKASKPIQLFHYDIINFDKIVYNLSYRNPPKEAKYLVTSTFRDEPSFSKLKLYISSLLSFILITLMVIYVKSFYIRFSGWRVEQKVTLYLLYFAIFYFFPLFQYIHFTHPSIFNLFLIHSSKAAFDSYLYIYCLIIIQAISGTFYNSKKKTKFTFFFCIIFFTELFHKMNPEITKYSYSSNIQTEYKSFFIFESFVKFDLIVYFLFTFGTNFYNLDSRYTRKALIYIEIFFVFLTIKIAAREITALFVFLKQGPLYYVTSSTLLAMIPITMLYFHLPLHKEQAEGVLSGSDDFSSDDKVEIFPQIVSMD